MTPKALQDSLRADGRHVFDGGDVVIDATATFPARPLYLAASKPTRLIQKSGPMFRLTGNHCVFGGQAPIEIECNGKDPVFEIEGSHIVSTGYHRFNNVTIKNAPPAGAWAFLAGRYVDGKFVADPNHADNCLIDNCHVFGKSFTFARVDNLQALNNTARDCSVNIISDEDAGDAIGVDLHDGGLFNFERLVINHPRFTMFKVYGVSANTCRLTSRDFKRDCPTTENAYLTILDDSRVAPWIDEWKEGRWILKVTGFVPRNEQKYDASRHFTKRALYDKERSEIQIDVSGSEPQ